MTPLSEIPVRLASVRERIRRAAVASGRAPESVRLLAVSKFQPLEAIHAAYAAGQRDFGENYVQELREKASLLANLPDLRLHLIGHLQTNKVRQVIGFAAYVHTIDSLRLVDELDKRLAQSATTAVASPNRTQASDVIDRSSGRPRLRCFVAVNIAGEEQKSGAPPEEVPALVERVRRSEFLSLEGLFTVPPLGSPESARPHFEALRKLRDSLGGEKELPGLSMGMSADLEIAVASGATWVRVGTDVFGARPAREVTPSEEP